MLDVSLSYQDIIIDNNITHQTYMKEVKGVVDYIFVKRSQNLDFIDGLFMRGNIILYHN